MSSRACPAILAELHTTVGLESSEPACNPVAQAKLLNRAGTNMKEEVL